VFPEILQRTLKVQPAPAQTLLVLILHTFPEYQQLWSLCYQQLHYDAMAFSSIDYRKKKQTVIQKTKRQYFYSYNFLSAIFLSMNGLSVPIFLAFCQYSNALSVSFSL